MAERRKHILAIRFSALGDVAILAPVLKQKMAENPEFDVTVAAPPMLAPLFEGVPHLSFMGIDKHSGNFKIFRQLISVHPTAIADLHSVTRSFLLDFLFTLCLKPVHIMLKQRIKRKRLLKNKNVQLATSWQHYDYVLRKCGMKGVASMPPYFVHKPSSDGIRRVGIAPFSTSRGKNYPMEKMEKVVSMLVAQPSMEVYLFGGKKYHQIFNEWIDKYPGTKLPSASSFTDELNIIKNLDVMVSMDSANLHFASAVGVPAITVWGATHPYCGFAGWRQNPEWSVQLDLPCRPCSIYGSKPCCKGTYECMESLDPELLYGKVMDFLNS